MKISEKKIKKALHELPIAWTVKVGTGLKTPADFHKALKDADCQVERANEMVDVVVPSENENELDIVLVYAHDLGIRERQTNQTTVRDLGQKMGLQLMTIESLIQLRLQFDNKAIRKVYHMFTIAMEPVFSSRKTFLIGCFVNGGGDDGVKRFHSIDIEDPTSTEKKWDVFCKWAFIKPRV